MQEAGASLSDLRGSMVEQIVSRAVKRREDQSLTWPWRTLWAKHAGVGTGTKGSFSGAPV